nr:MAG TPA: hypothetical protein [Caudoviricetes sp.]
MFVSHYKYTLMCIKIQTFVYLFLVKYSHIWINR